jgi:hypothetical protein
VKYLKWRLKSLSNQRQTEIMEIQKEIATEAHKVIDNDHAYIHLGKKFSGFYKATIASGQTLSISIQTPAVANGYVHFRGLTLAPSVDKVSVDIYEGATIDVAGTEIVLTNRRRVGTPAVAGTAVKRGTTFSANGTLLDGLSEYYPGSTGAGTVRIGAEGHSAAEEVVLKPSTVYRIVITNGSSAENIIGIGINLYEESMG